MGLIGKLFTELLELWACWGEKRFGKLVIVWYTDWAVSGFKFLNLWTFCSFRPSESLEPFKLQEPLGSFEPPSYEQFEFQNQNPV